jgi:hypothetical protein
MPHPNYECPVCKKLYYRYPSSIKRNRDITCSRYCAARYFRDKGETKIYPICSKSFYVPKSVLTKGYGNFCSHECWGSTRKTPLGSSNNPWTHEQRAQWTDTKCARCGATKNLELDHILARSLGGKSTRENAQTLCKICNLRKFQLEDLPAYLAKINSIS